MTGDSPVLDHPALRAALLDMRIDPPHPGTPFETALATLQGWNPGFAERVTDEYRRFLYLAATAGFEVTPSQSVDEAWHLHLTLPHYRDILCGRILGRPLEHRPGTGTADDEQRCARQYAETLALYERVFDEPAPHDIWPRPASLEEEEEEEDSSWWQGRESRLAAALITFAVGVAALAIGLPGAGIAFVAFAIVLGASLLAEPHFQTGRRRRGGGGGCGVGDAGSDCGSSCGGGGCGGD